MANTNTNVFGLKFFLQIYLFLPKNVNPNILVYVLTKTCRPEYIRIYFTWQSISDILPGNPGATLPGNVGSILPGDL